MCPIRTPLMRVCCCGPNTQRAVSINSIEQLEENTARESSYRPLVRNP